MRLEELQVHGYVDWILPLRQKIANANFRTEG